MYTIEDLRNYERYLETMDAQLKDFFSEQEPYICCQEGCSHCCKSGEYPISKLEFTYLNIGMTTLPIADLEEINSKVRVLKAEKEKHNSEDGPYYHECPFLKNDRCLLYEFRSLISRAHGLAYFSKTGKVLVPACVDKGLNYSQVYDFDTMQISKEKFHDKNIK